jgi:selenocysteine lyase/cysteine desulfurase
LRTTLKCNPPEPKHYARRDSFAACKSLPEVALRSEGRPVPLGARPEHHGWIDPAVVSWGFGAGSGLAEKHEWQGTFDPAAWLSIPTALDAWHELDLERCRELARRGRELLAPVRGVPAPQMWSSRLPAGDPDALWAALRRQGIDAPVLDWRGARLVRVSIAPYHDWADVERLVDELERLVSAP